jgi:hypothetical protein
MKLLQVPVQEFSHSIQWSRIFEDQLPVLIKGLASSWASVSDSDRKWSNLSSLAKRFDVDRQVNIEVGESYMDPTGQIRTVGFRDFITYMDKFPRSPPSDHPVVYLAQYELKDIPELLLDLKQPEICSTGKGHQYRSNIWFGSPLGTVSPAHTDPFNNILVQIIGKKHVELVHPKFSQNVYPAIGTVQKNTSKVDFSCPDLRLFPLFSDIEKYTVELSEGDGLFIPFKWWHYCKTTSLSCSVNYWWL